MATHHTSLSHWADQNAQKIMAARKTPEGKAKASYVCASGITPSGTVHIGNFREIISVDLVHRALLDRGVQSRFIYSWDNYDAFRKVPGNIPDREGFEKYLRLPIVDIPDPQGQVPSYARSYESAVEAVLPRVGIEPEYIYQTEQYRSGVYAEGIRTALKNRELIRSILNEHRTTELADDWWPVSIFSRFTGKDTTTVCAYDGEWGITYRCNESGKEDSLDLRMARSAGSGDDVGGAGSAAGAGLAGGTGSPGGAGSAGIKLLWRIDWPMRWDFEQVDFEPAGKEHHSAGGSFDTARRISREVYGYEPPVTFKYDFISIKGRGGKISSSIGNVISIEETLEVYQAEVLRYLFAGTRPNAEFAISFDLDVIKIYEDYDRCERLYHGLEDANEKRQSREGRIYELSQTGNDALLEAEALRQSGQAPLQFPFRHLCNHLLVHNGNLEAALNSFPGAGAFLAGNSHQRATARGRARCAWNWLQNHAPEEFRFSLRSGDDAPVELANAERAALRAIHALVESGGLDTHEKILQDKIYEAAREQGIDPRGFFVVFYRVLIGREKGPRLATFLKTLGKERVLNILSPYHQNN